MTRMQRLSDTSTNKTHVSKGPGTHLVLTGHVHLVTEKLGKMHDSHGCWASQEAHACLLGKRHSRAGVPPGTLSQPTLCARADPSTHLLLVAIPILQGAFLLFPVSAEGEGMKQGKACSRQDLTAHKHLEGPPGSALSSQGMGTAWEKRPA